MALAQHVALVDQLGEDLVGTALRDPDSSGDIAQPDAGVMGDAEEDVSVVGEEVPAARRPRRRLQLRLRLSGKSIHETNDTLGSGQQPRRFIRLGGSLRKEPPMSITEPRLPFAGYERLDAKQVIAALSRHSQVELEAVEEFERAHKDRQPVLDKLRYMRGPEPLPNYDALSLDAILVALEHADVATIKKVRGYERKFAKRHDVLELAVRVQHERRAAEPAGARSGYQPMTVTSGASRLTSRSGH